MLALNDLKGTATSTVVMSYKMHDSDTMHYIIMHLFINHLYQIERTFSVAQDDLIEMNYTDLHQLYYYYLGIRETKGVKILYLDRYFVTLFDSIM